MADGITRKEVEFRKNDLITSKRSFFSEVNLPALLNDPRLARRELDFFTKTWGESFDTIGIVSNNDDSVINREDFKKYAKKVLRHLRKINRKNKFIESKDLNQNNNDNSLDEDDKIPKIFFLPNFSLETPTIFASVVQTTDPLASRCDLKSQNNLRPTQSIKLQHEKLSYCLDTIESKLAKQISAKSDMLFSMVKFQNDLQDNMKKTTMATKFLREKTQTVEKTIVDGPLKLMKLVKTKSAMNAVLIKLQLTATIHQTKPTLQLMFETNEFVGALDLIQTTKEILTQELEGIACFRYLFSELSEMEKQAIQKMEHYFRQCVQMDLESIGYSVPEESTVLQEDKISAVVTCLLRLNKLDFLAYYHEDICDFLKTVVKEKIMQAVSVANVITQGGLADQMRVLNYSQWSTLFNNICDTLLSVLNRVLSFCNLVTNIFERMCTEISNQPVCSTVSSTPVAKSSVILTSNGKVGSVVQEMLASINDHIQERCVKVLTARAKDGFLERLGAVEFIALWQNIDRFVEKCEAMTQLKCSTIKASMQHQASQFIGKFHEEQKTKLSLILDNERWKQANVPIEFQQLVDYIQSSSQLRLCEKKTDDGALLESQHNEYLIVDGRKFVVVGTALMLLRMIVEYCQHAEDLPCVAWNILTQLVELIKMFNSRTCQLILGAGALQMVGLKTISVRNLALASSCLQLIVYYLPVVQKYFHARIEGRQLNIIRYFEQISKDYKDHMVEIDNQLVAVITSMIEQNLNKVTGVQNVIVGIQTVVKQIVKCHESIADAVTEAQLADIFKRIHSVFMTSYNKQRLSIVDINADNSTKLASELVMYKETVGALSGLSSVDLSTGTNSYS